MRTELLRNVAEIIAGQSPPSETYNKSGDGIPFFQGKSDYGDKFPEVRNWCKKPIKISLPDDILISVRAPVGSVNININEACIGRGLSAIRVKKNFSHEYIYYFLKANEKQIAGLGVGSTFKAITQKELGNIKIVFPDTLSDQFKIATLLSQAESLIKQRKENIDLLEKFLKSSFLKMFGDPVRNEKGWKRKNIGELSINTKGAIKTGPFGSQLLISELVSEGIPVYGIDNVQKNQFVHAKPKFITAKKYDQLIAFKIKADDILITRTGTVGRTCLAPKNIPECIIGPNLIKITLNNEIVLPIYISIAFNYCDSIIDAIKELSPGATVPVFNTKNLKSLSIGIPPIALQTQFAEIVKKIQVIKAQFKASLIELENLYESLSQKAFKGELDLSKMDVQHLMPINSYNTKETSIKITSSSKNTLTKKGKKQAIELKDKRYGDPFEVDEKTAKKLGAQFYKQWKDVHQNELSTLKDGHAYINWEWLANQLKNRYRQKHFNFEMLLQFLKQQNIANSVPYFSSEEMKIDASLNESEDLKSFIQNAIQNIEMDEKQKHELNPFLKIRQYFYNAESENFVLNLHNEDYKLMQNKSTLERSGLFFTILEEVENH